MAKSPYVKKIIEDFLSESPCGLGPPRSPGVYGIYMYKTFLEIPSKSLLYIGSSKNVRDRVMKPDHPYLKLYRRLSHHNVSICTVTLITEDYKEAEKILIRNLRPRLNKAHKY